VTGSVRRCFLGLTLASLLVVSAGVNASANETGGAVRCVGGNTSFAGAYNEAFRNPLGNWQAGDVPQPILLPDGSAIWFLNDSYINRKSPSSGITADSTIVRNVAVKQVGSCFEVLAGPMPEPESLTGPTSSTSTSTTLPGTPTTTIKPTSFLSHGEAKDKTWWWFHGGDVDGDLLRVFVTDMVQTGPPGWGIAFEPSAVWIATYSWRSMTLLDLRQAPDSRVGPAYGFSVVNEGGWTYLFGNYDNLVFAKADRRNFVARVPLHQLFATPQYWNGQAWVANRNQAVSISTEGTWDHRMRVFHDDDRWIATAKSDDFFGADLLILEAPQAQGPWVITQRVPAPPLTDPATGVTYDGIALPHVVNGKIIVNWSNNQYDFARIVNRPDRYRPTFTDVTLGPPTQSNAICHGEQPRPAGTLQPAGQASAFAPIGPLRIVDTRNSLAFSAGESRVISLAKLLPASVGPVSAVALNVTMVEAAAPGFLTVWPSGGQRPEASNLNIDRAGATAADFVTTAVSSSGEITVFSSVAANVIVDVAGTYKAVGAAPAKAGRYVVISPTRLLDTRSLGITPGAGSERTLAVAGRDGIPTSGVAAVVANLTGTGTKSAGFVTAWATGDRPNVSNLNLSEGMTRANQAVIPVGPDGSIRLYNDASTHLILDVTGYITDASAAASTTGLFVPVVPIRLLDSRSAPGIPGTGCTATVTIPATASSALLTMTLVDSRKAGFATAWPAGQAQPATSTLNLDAPGQTRANHAIVTLGQANTLNVWLEPRAHLLADLAGYFT
jgi:hypothetical protein